MGVRRVVKKGLKYLAPTLLVLLLIPFATKRKSFVDAGENPAVLKCAIALNDFDRMASGYITGYSYELLQRFAADAKDTAEIFIADSLEICLDSLLLDSLSILVMPLEDLAALPEGLIASPPVDSLTVWIFKDDRRMNPRVAAWLNRFQSSPDHDQVYARFFKGFNPYRKVPKQKGIISPYDALFKEYAPMCGLDWQMLAAIAWSESKFRIQARSSRGAAGLMQLVPVTAKRFGAENPLDPEQSIRAGAGYIRHIMDTFRDHAADSDELMKFALAAYHAGEGRILDCISFADRKGIDASRWENVRSIFSGLSDGVMSEEEVRFGKFTGIETAAYVDAVMRMYRQFCSLGSGTSAQPAAPGTAENDELVVFETIRDSIKAMSDSLSIGKDSLLLRTDSLSRVNPRDEHARNEEKEQDD